MFFFELEIFRTDVAEKIVKKKIYIVLINFFPRIVPFMR